MSLRARLAAAVNRILSPFSAELVHVNRRLEVDEFWRPLSRLNIRHIPERLTEPFSVPFMKGFQGRQIASLQEPADFAVIIPTILRPTIIDAIQSVFDQRFDERVQILIGIDASKNGLEQVERLCRSVPDRQSVLLFYPGYSTSRRHGGVHYDMSCGSLRTVLSYLANSRYIAYLDDDNWWADDHLSTLHEALSSGAEWAYALRWFVHPESRRPICKDEWESVGPGLGCFADHWGGWVDPNCLAIDKIACEAVLRWWSIPTGPGLMDSDRSVFRFLRTNFRAVPTGRHSVFYEIRDTDSQHPHRLGWIGEQRYRSFAQRMAEHHGS